MQKELVSFQVAKLAKEKGFDWLCNGFYDLYDNPHNNEITYSSPDNWNLYKSLSAPTQSLLQRWLREVHDINVLISFETIDDSETAYIWNIIEYIEEGKDRKKDTWDFYNRTNSFSKMMWYDTYEEALEVGLQEGLKMI